jgi:hypothetical protein
MPGRSRADLVAEYGPTVVAQAERTTVPGIGPELLARRCRQIAQAIERDRERTLASLPARAAMSPRDGHETRRRPGTPVRPRVRAGRVVRPRPRCGARGDPDEPGPRRLTPRGCG